MALTPALSMMHTGPVDLDTGDLAVLAPEGDGRIGRGAWRYRVRNPDGRALARDVARALKLTSCCKLKYSLLFVV